MDPITLQLYNHRFTGVAEEMGVTLQRTAYSPNIKERLDFSCALFDGAGRLIAQAAHIPAHLGAMPASVLTVLDHFPTWEEGDLVIVNDPFEGGNHLPDITMIAPVFVGEGRQKGRGARGEGRNGLELIAGEPGDSSPLAPRPSPLFFVASRAHHADVGGMAPGSLPLSTEIYQEGIIIPPLKLVRAGVGNEDLLRLILRNVRTPDERRGDIAAQRAAAAVGIRRLQELVTAFGQEEVLTYAGELCAYSERITRAAIGGWPDGTFTFADVMEVIEGDRLTLAPIQVAATIAGDEITFDFAGTSPVVQGSLNAVIAITQAACYYVVRCLLDEDVPMNAGCFAPVHVVAPVNSLLNALPPAAVAAGNVETSQRIVDVVLGALAQALPERIPAASQGTMNNLLIGGRRPDGTPYTYYETIGGGGGASATLDGLSGAQVHMTNTLNTPVEALEIAFPLRLEAYGLRRGSGGAGEHQGGDGLVREYTVLVPAIVTMQSERRVVPPWGLAGGAPGSCGRNLLFLVDGTMVELPSKFTRRLLPGERLRIETPGGGGWGRRRRDKPGAHWFAVAADGSLWVQAREAVKLRAQELGVALLNIHLPFNTATGDSQLGLIEQLLAQELDALITPRLPEAVARQLVAAGLPLVFADEMDYGGTGMVSPRGLYDAGALAGAFMLDQIGYRGVVLLVGGQQRQLATVQARVNGFRQALAPHPEVRCVQAPALWRYDVVYSQLLEEAEAWLPELDGKPVAGLYGLSDSLALAGRDVGRQLGFVDRRTRIVGINGDPLAIAAIVEGSMHGTVETSAHELAHAMVHYACLAARHEPLPLYFPYALRLVTSENAAQVAAERLVEIADLPTRLVDVTRRQEEQRLLHMQASLEINQRVGAILDTAELLAAVGEIIGSRYDADHVQFYFWREEELCLVCAEPVGLSAARNCLALAEAGVLGQALLRNQAVYVPDLQTSQRFAPDPRWPAVRSRVVLPIRVGGKTLGVLDLHNDKRTLRTELELDALQTLADQVGVALRNAQLYAQALAAKAEAERANLLRTRLLANASHELRTPLNIILGYSEAALSEPNPYNVTLPAELRTDLQHIHTSGSHLVRLVDDLLSLSLAEIGALETVPEPLDAHALLSEVFASMAGSRSNSAVDWRLELPAALPVLWADPVRLRQVLLDLLSNADKHTVTGHIALRAAARAETLEIWVEDTGAGILRAQQQRLNDYLTAWDETEGEAERYRFGIGLGLTVARHIVQLHGGILQVESQPGHGTICHVQLPLTAGQADIPAPAAPVHEVSGPEAQERVLNNILHHASELPRQIARYISQNYAAAIARDDIARALQVSEDYVSRTFRKETGMTPWQFLNRYRVLQAQKLLLTSSHNVTEIAALVGFTDPGYFVRVFHRETGKSPQHYRKSAK